VMEGRERDRATDWQARCSAVVTCCLATETTLFRNKVTNDRFRIFDFLSCHSTARGTSSPRAFQATELGVAAVSPVDPILIAL